jgi:DNA invertase Pin-like site-specific DNA recombinase
MARRAPPGLAGAPNGPRRLIAYYRVSTAGQGASGLGLDAQSAAVGKYAAERGAVLIADFTDVESGRRSDRPELARALAASRAERATLIVAKLDRLTRNAGFLLSLVEGQGEGGVVFCDLPDLPAGPIGKFILTQFAAVAELEAGMTSMRTIAALERLKARGVPLGNPRLRSDGAGPARRRAARDHARSVIGYVRDAQGAGANTLQKKAAALTARGIRTSTGKLRWSAEQVSRVEKLAATGEKP